MSIDYTEYYTLCKKSYLKNNKVDSKLCIDDINVTIINPNKPSDLLELPANYMSLIDNISNQVSSKLSDNENCFFIPNIKPNEDVSLRLKDKVSLGIDGVNELCSHLLPQIESKYFQSFLQVEKMYFYRNIITKNAPRTSWLWHYDNHPKEIHKIIIYLNDVNEDSGPFEYLKDANDKAIIVSPSRTGPKHWGPPKWPQSRVPLDVIEKYINKGYKATKAVGEKGTILFFDNNCIHKANIGKSGYRDVLALQIRPTLNKLIPYVNSKWTGGFEANDISKDPTTTEQKGKWAK